MADRVIAQDARLASERMYPWLVPYWITSDICNAALVTNATPKAFLLASFPTSKGINRVLGVCFQVITAVTDGAAGATSVAVGLGSLATNAITTGGVITEGGAFDEDGYFVAATDLNNAPLAAGTYIPSASAYITLLAAGLVGTADLPSTTTIANIVGANTTVPCLYAYLTPTGAGGYASGTFRASILVSQYPNTIS